MLSVREEVEGWFSSGSGSDLLASFYVGLNHQVLLKVQTYATAPSSGKHVYTKNNLKLNNFEKSFILPASLPSKTPHGSVSAHFFDI